MKRHRRIILTVRMYAEIVRSNIHNEVPMKGAPITTLLVHEWHLQRSVTKHLPEIGVLGLSSTAWPALRKAPRERHKVAWLFLLYLAINLSDAVSICDFKQLLIRIPLASKIWTIDMLKSRPLIYLKYYLLITQY